MTIPNSGFHIERIISAIPCSRHGADVGEPCRVLNSINGPLLSICDNRAREAGATGKITPYKKTFASKPKKDHSR